MKKERKEPGIVLAIAASGDSDQIVTLLTKESGKIKAFARNARRSKKRFMGGVDILDCARFSFSSSPKSELYRLEEMNERLNWTGLRANLNGLAVAMLAIELSERLAFVENQESAILFEPLLRFLKRVDATKAASTLLCCLLLFILEATKLEGYDLSQSLKKETEREIARLLLEKQQVIEIRDHLLLKQMLANVIAASEEIIERELRSKKYLPKLKQSN